MILPGERYKTAQHLGNRQFSTRVQYVEVQVPAKVRDGPILIRSSPFIVAIQWLLLTSVMLHDSHKDALVGL